MGAKSNPRLAHEEPLPRGLAPQRRGLGIPELQSETHPAAPTPTEPLGASPVIQDGKTGRALQPLATFKGPCAKTLDTILPLASALNSAHSSTRRTAGTSVQLAYWGLTLTLNPNP